MLVFPDRAILCKTAPRATSARRELLTGRNGLLRVPRSLSIPEVRNQIGLLFMSRKYF